MDEQKNLVTAPATSAADEAPAVNPLETAIDAALATLDDPMLTPIGYLRAMLERTRALTVHPSRQAEAARILEEFVRLGIDALRTDISNSFARLPELTRKFHALSRPLPETHEIDRISSQLRASGWAAMEIDILRQLLKSGEKMVACDAREIRLDSRRLTRRGIRDGGRPAWAKTAPGWNQLAYESQFRDGLPIPGERQA